MRPPLTALLLAPEESMWIDTAAGKKCITIREGHRDYTPGRPVMICCHLMCAAVMADITSVRHTTIAEVIPAEFEADGFTDRDDMLNQLRRFYPDLTEESPVTVIQWDNVRGRLVDELNAEEDNR